MQPGWNLACNQQKFPWPASEWVLNRPSLPPDPAPEVTSASLVSLLTTWSPTAAAAAQAAPPPDPILCSALGYLPQMPRSVPASGAGILSTIWTQILSAQGNLWEHQILSHCELIPAILPIPAPSTSGFPIRLLSYLLSYRHVPSHMLFLFLPEHTSDLLASHPCCTRPPFPPQFESGAKSRAPSTSWALLPHSPTLSPGGSTLFTPHTGEGLRGS